MIPDRAPENAGPPASGRRLGDLGRRFGSALVLVALALLTLWHSGQAFWLFWLAAAVLLHWEWQRMVGGPLLLARRLAGAAALTAAAATMRPAENDLAALALLAGAALLAALAPAGRRAWAGAGVLYAGSLLVSLWLLRFSNPGIFRHMAILWLFAVVWGTDVMAYFGGRLIGGPKLAPAISPGKTWSGTLTGVASGAALGALVAYAFRALYETPVAPGPVFFLGLGVAAVAQAGDLMESLMKRHFNVKDSGMLIPGHGGVMDRLDGFVAAAFAAACIGVARFGPGLAVNGLFQW